MANDGKVKIELCMGSSCFARGNSSILSAIESYANEKGVSDRIELEGQRCLGRCNSGPHISINGKEYSALDAENIVDLISKELS